MSTNKIISKIIHIIMSIFVLCICSFSWAQDSRMDVEFAKMMVGKNASYADEDIQFVDQTLSSLSEQNLVELKRLITSDITNNSGLIVQPLPVEQHIAYRLINDIDDRLGCLNITRIIVGQFRDITGGGSGILYYNVETNNGNILNVYLGAHTLMSPRKYRINRYDDVQLYLKEFQQQSDQIFMSVVKLELLKNNSPHQITRKKCEFRDIF